MSGHEPLTYAAAGVDLDAADRSVELIGEAVRRTLRAEVLGDIGGFGGLFELDMTRYRNPVLVSGTDGVGTKVDYARRLDRLDTIGIDLVAMVVDDLVVPGAEPLFFNDYISIGRLDPDRVATLVGGIADGCALAGCSLVGGEAAEHPGLLAPDEFDLAGFGVAVVERDEILGPDRVRSGDLLIGMRSSGLHSNGYSLVRRIVGDRDLHERHGLSRPLADELLEPTRIYAAECLLLRQAVEVHALCHVTGGGLPGNLPRVLPEGLSVHVDTATWEWPEIFGWVRDNGPVTDDEMWRTFNCGVGMVAIVPPEVADDAIASLRQHRVDAWLMGGVVESTPDAPRVQLAGT